MEQALCMAHWLQHCKVNEPIYILPATVWVKWQGRRSLLCAVALWCSIWRNVSSLSLFLDCEVKISAVESEVDAFVVRV